MSSVCNAECLANIAWAFVAADRQLSPQERERVLLSSISILLGSSTRKTVTISGNNEDAAWNPKCEIRFCRVDKSVSKNDLNS